LLERGRRVKSPALILDHLDRQLESLPRTDAVLPPGVSPDEPRSPWLGRGEPWRRVSPAIGWSVWGGTAVRILRTSDSPISRAAEPSPCDRCPFRRAGSPAASSAAAADHHCRCRPWPWCAGAHRPAGRARACLTSAGRGIQTDPSPPSIQPACRRRGSAPNDPRIVHRHPGGLPACLGHSGDVRLPVPGRRPTPGARNRCHVPGPSCNLWPGPYLPG
jgi:hypothetical protein